MWAAVVVVALGQAALAAAQERPAPSDDPTLAQERPAPSDTPTLPPVRVIAPAPLPGERSAIDREKVPATTHSLSADDITRGESPTLTDTLFQRIPGVSLSDASGNSLRQDLQYRGFFASPIQGQPQGLAVYQNGIRINEAFGDTVNWDLIPTNAIQGVDVWSSNPVFGLNALGGAVSLRMKDGFTFQGFEADVLGGSYGRISGGLQYGVRKGEFAFYVAGQGLHDDGWRDKSPSEIGRLYADVGWRNDRAEVHLTAALAKTSFGAAAATPVELLDRDFRSIYTNPQTTDNEMFLVALNGTYAASETWTLQGNAYARGFRQRHIDGNAGEFERCSNAASPQFRNQLCLEDDGFPRPTPVTTAFRDQFAILDQFNQTIPCPPGAGNTCAPVPYGTLDRTDTKAVTFGVSLQATTTADLFGHGNHLVVGASVDTNLVNFAARSTLGFINPALTITTNNPAVPGLGSIIHTFGDIGVGSVDLDARSTYYGVYGSETFDITDRLSATVGGRLNVATLRLRDQLGTTPDLDSDATYVRFNPVVGLTYKIARGISTYVGYSESNRVPTPLENACSNPSRPCLVENFLVSDPPLDQVVARTYQLGFRGNVPVLGGTLEWTLGGFRTDSTDDIVHVASVIQGRGVFQNVPETRRQGVEASAQYQSSRWLAYVSYSYVDATYQFTDDLPSPNNPFADEEGDVHVKKGKHIPGIPRNQGKLGLDVLVTPEWKVGGDIAVVGSRYFVGDDANQNPKLAGYWVMNFRTSYDITRNVQLFALVNNLFDKRYSLFGTFFDPAGVANTGLPVTLTNPRTEVLGAPVSAYGGVRVRF